MVNNEQPFFKLSHLYYAYPSQLAILQDINLELYQGQRLCITGANGSGKSTLLKLMVGLIKPQKGHIQAFGLEPKLEKDFLPVRRQAGLVFQDADDQLFCPTVADDVAFGPLNQGKSQAEALACVEKVLADMELSYLQDRITHKLSGGEKRLVALASVLAMSPKVLLLDEPTNALDEKNTERLIEILQNLPQAMLIVSHDPHFRRKVSDVNLRLVGGKLLDPDPHCRHAIRNLAS